MFGAECAGCIYERYPRRTAQNTQKAGLAIVSEAPSVSDLRQGSLFNSTGGQTLINTLQRVGLPHTVQDVYMTTVVRCAWPKKKGVTLSTEAVHRCRERLIQELRESGARIVLALGNSAIRAVLNNQKIKVTEVIGMPQSLPELPDVKIIPLEHPATMLYAPGKFKTFHQQMERVASLYHEEEQYQLKPTQKTIARTIEDLIQLRDICSTKEYVGIDIETTDLLPFYNEDQGRVGKMINIGIAYEPGKAVGIPKELLPHMPIVFAATTRFVWHGGKFDAMFTTTEQGYKVPLDEDAMLLHYCLNETSGTHDLEQLAMQYLGAEAYKSEANAYIRAGTFGEAPEEVQMTRVCTDADYTLQIFLRMLEEINSLVPEYRADILRLYRERLLPGAVAYANMQRVGMRVDEAELDRLDQKYQGELARILREVEQLAAPVWDPEIYMRQANAKTAPEHFNPGSPKQMSWLVFDRLQLRPRIKKGRSTDFDVLDSIENPPPVIQKVLEYRSVKKEHGTYVIGMKRRRDPDGRVHSSFNLHITSTGRRSSTDPNLQNIPSRRPDIRRVFVPRPGYALMEVDYSAAESRVLAIVSNDTNFIRLFEEGRDPHGELAARLYGPNFTKVQRGRAKTVNFGVPYGREAPSVSKEADMSLEEAQGLIDMWAESYPQAWEYLQNCADLVARGESIRSPMGRYKRPGLVTPMNIHGLQNEYKNYTIQSTVAEFTLLAVNELDARYAEDSTVYTVDEVHDSIVLEVLDDPEVLRRTAAVVVEIMQRIPVQHLGWTLPFTCDVEVGYNWADLLDLEDFISYREVYAREGYFAAKGHLYADKVRAGKLSPDKVDRQYQESVTKLLEA